ncbi:hypothetical protein BCR35DRAFT_353404 [Leucosporidium creatinivorum]|uniref:Uncharacterized protein n=1 Tax=Leucosporidium creatinivorum TaxID=106004 RepID=A0A1Y2EXA3_9BASI|nr:hypothetical protein BCR35DRAFT_353404 [Leucosporidium creatinivorum]
MAVIQDHPPELLIRVLELSVSSYKAYLPDQADIRVHPSVMALVARSWRAPSQELLLSFFSTTSLSWVWERFLVRCATPNMSPLRRVYRLELYFGADSADQLALLQRHNVRLDELCILGYAHGRGLKLESFQASILRGIRRLELRAPIEVTGSFGIATPIMLDTLCVDSRLPKFPSFLLPLLTGVPHRLTRLDLDCSHVPLYRHYMATSLREIARQIADSRIKLPPPRHKTTKRDPSLPRTSPCRLNLTHYPPSKRPNSSRAAVHPGSSLQPTLLPQRNFVPSDGSDVEGAARRKHGPSLPSSSTPVEDVERSARLQEVAGGSGVGDRLSSSRNRASR